MRICSKCKASLPLASFYVQRKKEKTPWIRKECKQCHSQEVKRNRYSLQLLNVKFRTLPSTMVTADERALKELQPGPTGHFYRGDVTAN